MALVFGSKDKYINNPLNILLIVGQHIQKMRFNNGEKLYQSLAIIDLQPVNSRVDHSIQSLSFLILNISFLFPEASIYLFSLFLIQIKYPKAKHY